MKTLPFSFYFFSFFLLLCGNTAQARHIIGGEMTYACKDAGLYEVRLELYRDCNSGGADFDEPAAIAVYRQFGNTYVLVDNLSVSVSNRELLLPSADPCLETPPGFCMEKGVYLFEVNLPITAAEHLLVYQRCCRNPTINNMALPDETGITLSISILPDAVGLCNSSPVFNLLPTALACVNQPLGLNLSATDAEGDQLVYKFCAPLKGGGLVGTAGYPGDPSACEGVAPNPPCAPPYTEVEFLLPEYSALNPIGGNPVVHMTNSGFINGTPDVIGQFVYGVCVEEWRNGILLSVVRRDFQLNVTNCMGPLPDVVQGEYENDTLHIYTCGEQQWIFEITNLDESGVGTFLWEIDVANDGNFVPSTDWSPNYSFPEPGVYPGQLSLYGGLPCARTIPLLIHTEEDCPISSIPDLMDAGQIQLYPNPARDFLIVEMKENYLEKDLEFRITDFQGRVRQVQKTQGQTTRINTADLPNGVYLFQGYQEGRLVSNQRFVILN